LLAEFFGLTKYIVEYIIKGRPLKRGEIYTKTRVAKKIKRGRENMDILVMSEEPRKRGREVLFSLGKGRFLNISTTYHRDEERVLVFHSGRSSETECDCQKAAVSIGADFMEGSRDAFVSSLRRQGVIPEGWPRPLT
jgi:hypothetical protein